MKRVEQFTKGASVSAIDAQIDSLRAELDRGMVAIARTDDVSYRRGSTVSGSVGAQFRHNFDLVNALLKGISRGRIDYTDRERDQRIENDRAYAVARFRSLIDRIDALDSGSLGTSILIRSEIGGERWLRSSVERELEFAHSHTVHHHALIAEKLNGSGVDLGMNFGVAASTLEYWRKLAA